MGMFENEGKLHIFNEMLVERNRVVNLTAHKTVAESWQKNILDSLLFVRLFKKFGAGRMLDLGSGGGLPAIPLAVECPELQITMTDSVNKKIEFIKDIIDKLQLKNATAVHTRAEDFAEKQHGNREQFDIVTAKAVAELPTLLEYAMQFLKIGGYLFAFKGQNYGDEIEKSAVALRIFGGEIERVERCNLDNEITRYLLIIRKTKKIPDKYPRQKNLPRTQPLL
jgi:16S rRNA (guanine527-N7)-methyltransferase